MVLYLKYRPQSLDDLIGQTQIKETLSSAFKNNKLAHAYLFVGPRGTGKTSTARILAKMVNCEKEKVPCNKCSTCLSITDGSDLDLIEIDAASNRGIDDIRTLRENIKLAPTSGKKKIYIIDEVHMLTTEAFNALLKTLEEPPTHVMFILATTEVSKVPQTILSRVQRLNFNLATVDGVYIALKKIADSEKIKVEEEALKLIAKKAEGSFRDGVKLLDQLASGDGEITTKVISDNFKDGDFEQIINLLKSLVIKDSKSALMQITKFDGNVKNFVLSLMEVLRSLVYLKNGLEELVEKDFEKQKFEELKNLAKDYQLRDIILAIEKLQETSERLKTASIASLPLEIAVVEICSKDFARSEVLDSPTHPPRRVQTEENLRPLDLRSSDSDVEITESNNEDSSDLSKIKEKWSFVLETVRADNFSLEALLRTAKINNIDETRVLLEVPYAFHQRILESPKSRDLLEHIFSDVLERPIKIGTVLGTRPPRIEDIANVEIAQDDEIINLASEIFNGKLID